MPTGEKPFPKLIKLFLRMSLKQGQISQEEKEDSQIYKETKRERERENSEFSLKTQPVGRKKPEQTNSLN